MATQTRSQRQAAAKKAAATRKRNATRRSAAATKRSATATKTSARRTRRSASASAKRTTRSATATTRQAARTSGLGLDVLSTRLGVVGRRAQRAVLIPVGAAATVGDNLRQTARTYSSLDRVARELDRFERRGARTLARQQRSRRNGLRADAKEAAEQVFHLI